MNGHHGLRKWFGRGKGSSRQTPARRPRWTPLRLEELEPRCVPTLVRLASFDSATGAFPYGGLVEDNSGNLFGTVLDEPIGSNQSSVFEVKNDSGTITQLATFSGNDYESPIYGGGLVYGNFGHVGSGQVFGVSSTGGSGGEGNVFEFNPGNGTLTTLASFVNTPTYTNGAVPYGGLIEDAYNNLYGTTYNGGVYNQGAVFWYAQGSISPYLLASLNGSTGDFPYGGLVEDSSGNLFGTAFWGGSSNLGTVFAVPINGSSPFAIASFDGIHGSHPSSGLIEDSSGNLFGTTTYGGAYDFGTVFEIMAGSGTITTLASFDGPHGAYPQGGLVEDRSGNLFGTTGGGGANGDGTIFELQHGHGPINTLASFTADIGINPEGNLIQDSNGNLFGTAIRGGLAGNPGENGTVFEYTMPTITTSTVINGDVGIAYSQAINASGGTGALTFGVPEGILPPGLTLSSSGVLSGTPTTAGSYSFLVSATDTVGAVAFQWYAITISPPITITTPSLANWIVNQPGYSQTVSATGGSGALTFAQTAGTLPPGLTLSSSGVLSGTPITLGIYTFTITASDTVAAASMQSYTVNIYSATATRLNLLSGALQILIPAADTVNLTTTNGRLVVNDNTPGQTIVDNTGKFTISGAVGNETATENANLAGDFSSITITGAGRGQTVNFNGGSFLATSVNDGTIPTVHFGTALSTFSGNLAVQSSTALTVSAPVVGFGTIVFAAAGTNTALTISANITSENTGVTLQATGAVTISSGVVVNSGLGNLTLAGDVTAAGGGDDGIGTLTINANAGAYGGVINLRGPDVDIASTASVGSATASWSLPASPSVTLTGLSGPLWTTYDGSGNILVSNYSSGSGTTVSKFGFGFSTSFSSFFSGYSGPVPLIFDKSGNLYVGYYTSSTVVKFSPTGTVLQVLSGLSNPRALAFDSSGNLYVANQGSTTVSVFSPSGTLLRTLTAQAGPFTLAFDSSGNLYVANINASTVSEFAPGATTPFFTYSISVNQPTALAFDSSGYLYVANDAGNTVSKFVPGAGSPVAILSGLSSPMAMAFDGGGNLYVANAGANTVSKFAPGATTASATFTGLSQPSYLAFDGVGNLYVANFNNNTVSVFFQSNIAATTAVNIRSSVSSRPMSLGGTNNAAVAGVNLTSAELGRIYTAPGTITFGDGSQTGNITFTTASPGATIGTAIVAVQASGGPGTIILDDGAGSGTALSASGGTISLTAGTGGIVALSGSNSTAELATSGTTITLNTVGPIGTSSNRIQFADNTNLAQQNVVIGTMLQPASLYLDGLGSLTLGAIKGGASTPIDVTARTNLVVAANATVNSHAGSLSLGADLTAAGVGDDGVGTLTIGAGAEVYGANITLRGADEDIASTATVGSAIATSVLPSTASVSFLSGVPVPAGPLGLAFDSSGNLYVANYSGNTVTKFAPGATFFTGILGATGPVPLAFDNSGNLYVGNWTGNTVYEYSPSGTLLNILTGLSNPRGLIFDSSGNLYVANQGSNTVSVFSPGGAPLRTLTAQAGPYTMAFDSSGNLYVANSGTTTVSKFAPGATAPSATLGGLNTPDALAFDSSGNLYVGNQSGTTVGEFASSALASGANAPTANLTGLSNPSALAFDAFGDLYVANAGNGTISEFAPNGTLINTLTGVNPWALAFDSSGNLYVANFNSSSVSEFTATNIPATKAVTIRSSTSSRPMGLGGTNNAAVVGINLTSAELARVFTTSSGSITFGDSSQTGNIGFVTATPATTHGAATVVMQSGSGQITVNHNNTSAVALSGNGGSITLTSGSGGILRIGTNGSLANDIGNVSALSLTSAGALGFSGGFLLLDTATLTTNTSSNNGNQFFTTFGKTITIASMNAGSGTITLTGATGNKYQADGSITSPVTLNAGLLDGNGTTAAITVNNSATLQPGDSPGILHTGNLTLASTATFVAQMGGTAPGSGYSQDVASGTINLGGATLTVQLLNGFIPAVGQKFVLIANSGGAAVTGTFAGLPEGAALTVGGQPCHITYIAGAGNDVVLIANGPAITTTSLANWTMKQPGYSQTINTSGSSGTVTFSSTGNLPTGLTLSTSGVLSGTPTTVGSYTFTVTATDSASLSSSQNFTVIINPPVSIDLTTLATFSGANGANPRTTMV
jgi:uncharacterized repeat protein (TIGR03803 family)